MMNTPNHSRLHATSITAPSTSNGLDTANRSKTGKFALLTLLGILATQSMVADEVLYSDDSNPSSTYAKTALLLDEVFGSSNPTSGAFTETNAFSFLVEGTGMQDVTFNFLYEDGGYTFEFGYFIITDELLNMPTNSGSEKRAWATEALTSSESAAQTLIVDNEYPGSPPAGAFEAEPDPSWVNPFPSDSDAYMGTRSSANSTTVQLMGGTRIGFYIIPDNTLQNFRNDAAWGGYDDFSLTGNNSEAWPLFSYSDANPGPSTRRGNPTGSGEGFDQVMTFDGTTSGDLFGNGQETGTMVAFEDIRRIGNDSDNDFSDLVFFIGNVATETAVPEPSTVFAGITLAFAMGFTILRRKKLLVKQQ